MTFPMTAATGRFLAGVALIASGLILFRLGAPHDDAWALMTLGAAFLDPRRPIPGWPIFQAKEPKMDIQNDTQAGAVGAATTLGGAGADAPTGTAGADATPAINSAAVVNSVVQTVQAHPDVPQSKTASVVASILAGLYQAEPAIFAVSRASANTQAEVGLGLGLAQIILGAFLHPAS